MYDAQPSTPKKMGTCYVTDILFLRHFSINREIIPHRNLLVNPRPTYPLQYTQRLLVVSQRAVKTGVGWGEEVRHCGDPPI